MAPGLIRDSFFGQFVYELSNHRLFKNPEELPGFSYTLDSFAPSQPSSRRDSAETSCRSSLDNATLSDAVGRPDDEESRLPNRVATLSRTTVVVEGVVTQHGRLEAKCKEAPLGDELLMVEAAKPEVQQRISQSRIVDWYGPEDPDNPQNVGLFLYHAFIKTLTTHTVVLPQKGLRDLRDLSAHIQHLHRLCDLCPGYRCVIFPVRHILYCGYTRPHPFRRRLRHRAYVLVAALRATRTRTNHGIHPLSRHVRRAAGADRLREGSGSTSSFALPRGLHGIAGPRNRGSKPCGYVGGRVPSSHHRPLVYRCMVRTGPRATCWRVCSTGKRLDVDDLDAALGGRLHTHSPRFFAPRNVSFNVRLLSFTEWLVLTIM